MDLYRISDEEDLVSTGAEELIYGTGISIIEWGETLGAALPSHRIIVTISIESDQTRMITITFPESLGSEYTQNLRSTANENCERKI